MQRKEMSPLAWLVNPFERIAGAQALAIGAVLALAMSALALPIQAHFPGVLDYRLGVGLPFVRLLLQNAIAIMDLTLCFYLGSLLVTRKRLRLVDFLGTLSVARLPYFLLTAGLALCSSLGLYQMDVAAVQAGNLPTSFLVATLVTVIALIWLLILYFSALKVSSGMKGVRLWSVFIGGVLIAEVLTVTLSHQLAV